MSAASAPWAGGFFPDPELERSPDALNVRCCAVCRAQHVKQVLLDLDGEWFHGRCFIHCFGLAALLALPRLKLERLMLADVGPRVMQRVLRQLSG